MPRFTRRDHALELGDALRRSHRSGACSSTFALKLRRKLAHRNSQRFDICMLLATAHATNTYTIECYDLTLCRCPRTFFNARKRVQQLRERSPTHGLLEGLDSNAELEDPDDQLAASALLS